MKVALSVFIYALCVLLFVHFTCPGCFANYHRYHYVAVYEN